MVCKVQGHNGKLVMLIAHQRKPSDTEKMQLILFYSDRFRDRILHCSEQNTRHFFTSIIKIPEHSRSFLPSSDTQSKKVLTF